MQSQEIFLKIANLVMSTLCLWVKLTLVQPTLAQNVKTQVNLAQIGLNLTSCILEEALILPTTFKCIFVFMRKVENPTGYTFYSLETSQYEVLVFFFCLVYFFNWCCMWYWVCNLVLFSVKIYQYVIVQLSCRNCTSEQI